jgi:hypothetical protein
MTYSLGIDPRTIPPTPLLFWEVSNPSIMRAFLSAGLDDYPSSHEATNAGGPAFLGIVVSPSGQSATIITKWMGRDFVGHATNFAVPAGGLAKVKKILAKVSKDVPTISPEAVSKRLDTERSRLLAEEYARANVSEARLPAAVPSGTDLPAEVPSEATARWFLITPAIARALQSEPAFSMMLHGGLSAQYAGISPRGTTVYVKSANGGGSSGGSTPTGIPAGAQLLSYEAVQRALAPVPSSAGGTGSKLPLYLGLGALGVAVLGGAAWLLLRKKPAAMAPNRRRTSRQMRRNAGAKKPIYCGVFFDESEMAVLRNWFRRETGLELLPNIPKDPHLTSVFKPSLEAVSAMPLGGRVQITVTGWAADEKGQALVVSGFPSANATPHLTLSTAQGVSPVYSNELLSQGFASAQGPTVEGTVGYFDGAVQFSVPGGPAPLVSNASPKEIWWRCSRCGRSVHNHSKTRVTESRPKRCKKASGKTSTRCKFVRETSRGLSAGRTSKAPAFKKLSLKNARAIAASIDRAGKRYEARYAEYPETKKDVRDLKRVAALLRSGRTEQAVKRGWDLDTSVRDHLPARFYKIPSRAYPLERNSGQRVEANSRVVYAIPERRAYPITTAQDAYHATQRLKQGRVKSEEDAKRIITAIKREHPGVWRDYLAGYPVSKAMTSKRKGLAARRRRTSRRLRSNPGEFAVGDRVELAGDPGDVGIVLGKPTMLGNREFLPVTFLGRRGRARIPVDQLQQVPVKPAPSRAAPAWRENDMRRELATGALGRAQLYAIGWLDAAGGKAPAWGSALSRTSTGLTDDEDLYRQGYQQVEVISSR